MEVRTLTCIGCPVGCSISVEMDDQQITDIRGNTCPRGESYARKEITDPTRIVTSTVRLSGGGMVSVKTASPIPKDRIMDCMRELKEITVSAPIHTGQVLLENAAGTGIAIVATKEIKQ